MHSEREVPREDDVSMWTPMEPNLGRGDDGIPAADPGAGAPPTADGFGVGGEEPDRPEDADTQDADTQDADTQDAGTQDADTQDAGTQDAGTQDADAHGTTGDRPDDDPPFRTPDPGEVGRS